MSARTILAFGTGPGIDLLNPRSADVDWAFYAERLAKEARYNGGTPGVFYAVAQHVAIGVDAILEATGDRKVAGAFCIHDHPEAVLKDDTTPKKHAIAEIAQAKFGVLAPQILDCFNELTERHDVAIHQAAGMPWPLPPRVAEQVKHWDLVMFVTEWRDLMGGIAHPDWDRYRHLVPLTETLIPWPWERAADELYARCRLVLPVFDPEGRR